MHGDERRPVEDIPEYAQYVDPKYSEQLMSETHAGRGSAVDVAASQGTWLRKRAKQAPHEVG